MAGIGREIDGYVVCPNKWSSVYHYAVELEGHPGLMRSLCVLGGIVKRHDDRLRTWAQSAALQPIHVVNPPDDRRLCRECRRLAAAATEEGVPDGGDRAGDRPTG